jgi:DNA-directed RNA polymerase specialized sigma24 family protein
MEHCEAAGIASPPNRGNLGTHWSAFSAAHYAPRAAGDRFEGLTSQPEMAKKRHRQVGEAGLGENPEWFRLRRQLVKRARTLGGRAEAEDLAQEAMLRVLVATRSKAVSDLVRYSVRVLDRLRVDCWRRRRQVLEGSLQPEDLEARCEVSESAWSEARHCLLQAAVDLGLSPLDAAVLAAVRFDGTAWHEACAEVGLEGAGAEAAQRRISRFLSEDRLVERLYGRVAELRFAQPPTPNPQLTFLVALLV